jgi:hypothetical protein
MKIGKSVNGIIKSKISSIEIYNAITERTVPSVTFNNHIDVIIWDSIWYPIRRKIRKVL